MKIIFKRTTPSYRDTLSTQKVMIYLLMGLSVISLASVGFYFTLGANYGIKAVMMIAVSVISAYLCEYGYFYLMKEKDIKKAVNNSFPYITAVLFALILPIGTPYYVIISGSVFSILVGKLLFGGFGQNIFNPALIGRVFVMMSYGDKLVATLDTGGKAADIMSSATPTAVIKGTGWIGESGVSLQNLFFGFYKGSIGETFAILIIAVGIVLALKRVYDWRITAFYIGASFVMAFSAGLSHGLNPVHFALIHLGIGGLLFGAVFMITDPVTSPTNPYGKIIFAVGAAFFTMLLRFRSNMPEGVLYSILIMNMLTPMIDKYTIEPTNKDEKVKMAVIIGMILVLSIVISAVWVVK